MPAGCQAVGRCGSIVCVTIPTSAAPKHEALRRWWRDGVGGPLLYQQMRRAAPEAWSRALERLPEDDGPEPLPPPDRPPARMTDLPEVLALRALLQDRRVAFDTVERWIRALTQSARSLDETRPLEWSAEHVARRCAGLAHGAEGSLWSTLEVVRELWQWHPDRLFVEAQSRRLLSFLEEVIHYDQADLNRDR